MAEIIEGLDEAGFDFDRAAEQGGGLVEMTLREEQRAKAIVGGGKIGPKGQGLTVVVRGLIRPTLVL